MRGGFASEHHPLADCERNTLTIAPSRLDCWLRDGDRLLLSLASLAGECGIHIVLYNQVNSEVR